MFVLCLQSGTKGGMSPYTMDVVFYLSDLAKAPSYFCSDKLAPTSHGVPLAGINAKVLPWHVAA